MENICWGIALKEFIGKIDWSLLVSIISIILPIISIAGTSIVYFAHEKKLKKQQKELNEQKKILNDYDLEDKKRLDAERKQANVVATVERKENTVIPKTHMIPPSHVIIICNKGLSTAKNVRMESPDLFGDSERVFFAGETKFPYLNLIPNDSFNIPVYARGANGSYQIKLIWDDESGKDRVQEQSISF
jgi:hypothetical protein